MTEVDDDEQARQGRASLQRKPVLLTVGGLAALAVGGPAMVEGALRFTQAMGLRQGVVGATIVSLGTGAEMIALGVSSARKKRSDLLMAIYLIVVVLG